MLSSPTAGGCQLSARTHLFITLILTILAGQSSLQAQGPPALDLVTPAAKIGVHPVIAADGAVEDLFGGSVAISGNTVVVGAPFAAIGNNLFEGAVYVFVKPASGWQDLKQVAKLTVKSAPCNDCFSLGSSVAISGDTIVAGAPGTPVNGLFPGGAFVFVKPAGGWTDMTQTAELLASDGATNDALGASVVISGNTIVVGAPDKGLATGAAYVFARPAKGWADMTETAQLIASDPAQLSFFGSSIAINGSTVVVGAPDAGNGEVGAAYVFTKLAQQGGTITETAKLEASNSALLNQLGMSVGISGDTVMAGATGTSNQKGAVYVFVRPPGGWIDMTEVAQLHSSDQNFLDYFGASMAIHGNVVIVGAPSAQPHGEVYLFVRPQDGWKSMRETGKLLAPSRAAGFAASLSVGGGAVVVGAPATTVGSNFEQGAAFLVHRK